MEGGGWTPSKRKNLNQNATVTGEKGEVHCWWALVQPWSVDHQPGHMNPRAAATEGGKKKSQLFKRVSTITRISHGLFKARKKKKPNHHSDQKGQGFRGMSQQWRSRICDPSPQASPNTKGRPEKGGKGGKKGVLSTEDRKEGKERGG